MNDGFSMIDALVALVITGLVMALLFPLYTVFFRSLPDQRSKMITSTAVINLYSHLDSLAGDADVPYWASIQELEDDISSFSFFTTDGSSVDVLNVNKGIELVLDGNRFVYKVEPSVQVNLIDDKKYKLLGIEFSTDEHGVYRIPFAGQPMRSADEE